MSDSEAESGSGSGSSGEDTGSSGSGSDSGSSSGSGSDSGSDSGSESETNYSEDGEEVEDPTVGIELESELSGDTNLLLDLSNQMDNSLNRIRLTFNPKEGDGDEHFDDGSIGDDESQVSSSRLNKSKKRNAVSGNSSSSSNKGSHLSNHKEEDLENDENDNKSINSNRRPSNTTSDGGNGLTPSNSKPSALGDIREGVDQEQNNDNTRVEREREWDTYSTDSLNVGSPFTPYNQNDGNGGGQQFHGEEHFGGGSDIITGADLYKFNQGGGGNGDVYGGRNGVMGDGKRQELIAEAIRALMEEE